MGTYISHVMVLWVWLSCLLLLLVSKFGTSIPYKKLPLVIFHCGTCLNAPEVYYINFLRRTFDPSGIFFCNCTHSNFFRPSVRKQRHIHSNKILFLRILQSYAYIIVQMPSALLKQFRAHEVVLYAHIPYLPEYKSQ